MTKYTWSGLGPREQGVADGRSANEAGAFDAGLGALSEPARSQAMLAEVVAGMNGTGAVEIPLRGTGSPEGVVTAPVGRLYVQSDGADGEVVWFKNSGTGSTGWRKLQADSNATTAEAFGAVGDGSTDDTTALNAALATGKMVRLTHGKTYLVSALTVSANGTRLEGQGATIKGDGSAATLCTVSGNNCRVVEVQWDVTNTAITAGVLVSGTDNAVEGCAVTGAATDAIATNGIVVTGARNVVSCNTLSTCYPSIKINGATDTVVRENVLLNYRTGIYVLGTTARTTIQGNRLVSIGGSGVTVGFDGILIESPGTDFVIRGNIIAAAREHGMYISPDTSTPGLERGVIEGNVVSNVGSTGIKLRGGSFFPICWSVTGNTVWQNTAGTTVGMVCSGLRDAVVSGNSVRGCGTGLIAEYCENVVFSGNTITNSDTKAVSITDAVGASIGITFAHNHLVNTNLGGGGYGAIQVTLSGGNASSDWHFIGNVASDNQGVPTSRNILVISAPSGGSTLDSVFVDGNTATAATITKLIDISSSVTNVYRSGHGRSSQRTVTTAYTTTYFDNTVLADATSASFTISLLSAASMPGGRITVKKVDSSANTVTIDPASTQTVDALSTWVLLTQWQWVTLESNGTNWLVVASSRNPQGWVAKTTTATVVDSHDGLFLGGTSWTLTLQSAATRTRPLVLRCTASGTVTIVRAGADTIEGGTSITMVAGEIVALMPNGTDWLQVG